MAYIVKVRKIYLIFGVIALVELILNFKKEDHVLRLLILFGVILYFLIFVTITRLVADSKPNKNFIYVCMVFLVLNSLNYIGETIYTVIIAPSWTAAFSIISLALQASTLYIFYKFLEAIDKEALLANDGVNRIVEQPIYAVATPVPSAPMYVQPIENRAPQKTDGYINV